MDIRTRCTYITKQGFTATKDNTNNGSFCKYYGISDKVRTRCILVNGVKTGKLTKYDMDGKIIVEADYNKGILKYRKKYIGNTVLEETYKDNTIVVKEFTNTESSANDKPSANNRSLAINTVSKYIDSQLVYREIITIDGKYTYEYIGDKRIQRKYIDNKLVSTVITEPHKTTTIYQ